MSVVVSDTSPLHYLILCGVEGALPALFQRVVIPPAVFAELQHQKTPIPVRDWAGSLPSWVVLQKPSALDRSLNVDLGEMEAISLAKEIHAAALLIDDRAGRQAAAKHGLPVIGTLGILEQAAIRGLIDLPKVVERLQQTTARLDATLVEAILERHKARSTEAKSNEP